MKWIVFSTVSLLAASAVMIGVHAVLARGSPPDRTPAATRVAGAGPTIERVRELSALTTLRIDVADAFVTELRGRTGGTTAVLVKGNPSTFGPIGLCLDRRGRVWVSSLNDRVQLYGADGTYVLGLGLEGTGAAPGRFARPHGMAVDSQGNLYVADAGNQRVQKFAITDP